MAECQMTECQKAECQMAECQKAECQMAECQKAGCQLAKCQFTVYPKIFPFLNLGQFDISNIFCLGEDKS